MTDQPKQPGRWVQSGEGICEEYANVFHLTWSRDDIRMRFGQLVADTDGGLEPGEGFVSVTLEKAAITIPWRLAKGIRDQLTLLVNAYEALNTEIKIDSVLPDVPPKM